MGCVPGRKKKRKGLLCWGWAGKEALWWDRHGAGCWAGADPGDWEGEAAPRPPAGCPPPGPGPSRLLPSQGSRALWGLTFPAPSSRSGKRVCSVQGCDPQGDAPPSGRMSPPPWGSGMLWPPGRTSAQGKAGKMVLMMRVSGKRVTI